MPSSASTTAQLYTLSLHDALPISALGSTTTTPNPQRNIYGRVPVGWAIGQSGRTCLLMRHCRCFWHNTVYRIWSAMIGSCRAAADRSEEHTSELQSPYDLVCRLLLRRPPNSTPFPYTTLFRSRRLGQPLQRQIRRGISMDAFPWVGRSGNRVGHAY